MSRARVITKSVCESKELITKVADGKITVSFKEKSKPDLDSDMLARDNSGNIKIPSLKEKLNRSNSAAKASKRHTTRDKRSKSMKLANKLKD